MNNSSSLFKALSTLIQEENSINIIGESKTDEDVEMKEEVKQNGSLIMDTQVKDMGAKLQSNLSSVMLKFI
jgi:hypothetical protein